MRVKILESGAALLAIALSACQGGGSSIAMMTDGSETTPPVVVVISPPVASPASPVAGRHVSLVFDVTITASKAVDLHDATIHMIDGTNLGGPMITVPQPELAAQLGSASIPVGTTRRFTVRPPAFVWTGSPCSIRANLAFMDGFGVTHTITVERLWP
jgi:hypothetical protein